MSRLLPASPLPLPPSLGNHRRRTGRRISDSSCCSSDVTLSRRCGGRCTAAALDKLDAADLARRIAYRLLPPLLWLPSYRLPELAGDALAGITVGLTVLPQALAYAGLAGLRPQYGLYSAFMGCFVYSIFGGAKDVSVGPTAVMALLVSQFATSPVPKDATLAVLLTFGCGVIQILLGALHLGFVVNFIPYPVINSFTSAAAVTIALGEIKSLVGVTNVRRPFFQSMYDTFAGLPRGNLWDAGMAVACIGMLLAFGFAKKRYIEPRLRRLQQEELESHPAGIMPRPRSAAAAARTMSCRAVAMRALWVLCTARNALVLLTAAGVAALVHACGISESFSLTEGLQDGLPAFQLPAFSINETVNNETLYRDAGQLLQGLASGFVVVSLICVLEHVAISQAFARINDYKVNPNQEILALGLVNFFSSFVSSYPITASFTKSAINAASGVKTPAGGVWTGAIVLLALSLLAPYFAYIPSSALAAVIVVAVLDMVDVHIVLDLWRVRRVELLPYALTFLLSFPWGIEYGIMSGTGLSLLMLLYGVARPNLTKGQVDCSSTDEGLPGAGDRSLLLPPPQPESAHVAVPASTEVVRPRSGLTYPSVEYLCSELLRTGPGASLGPRDVVLDCTHVACVDYTAVHGLVNVASVFEKRGVRLFITAASRDVQKTIARSKHCRALVFAGDCSPFTDGSVNVPPGDQMPTVKDSGP